MTNAECSIHRSAFTYYRGAIPNAATRSFVLPICLILIYFTWGWFWDSFLIDEQSNNAGGLVRWPVKLLLPVGFALMALQGISEIIKRVAALERVIDAGFKYEKPLQ